MTSSEAIRYCLSACLIAGVLITFTCILGNTMYSTSTIKQEWLLNLKNLCGEKYEIDEYGDLIPSKLDLYTKTIAYQTQFISSPLGLYFGQVGFRYFDSGRLTHDSYSKDVTIWLQLVFSAIGVCLFRLPFWINKAIVDPDSVSLWLQTILMIFIPQFILCYFITGTIPQLTSRVFNYPSTLEEVSETDIAQDPEKGSSVKCLQLKGMCGGGVHSII